MAIKTADKKPTWSELKQNLAELDREALLALIQNLYAANKENKIFLHARFGLGGDILNPYKETIHRWICPDVIRNQNFSIAKAKKAISDYKKAVARPGGVAELSMYYCEACAELLCYCGMDDEGYFNALALVFEQALKAISLLEAEEQQPLIDRLERVWRDSHKWGYGIEDDMGCLMEDYGFSA